MGYHVFFAFSTGLREPIIAPKGTLASILAHVAAVEETLGIKRTKYRDNPEHWDTFDPAFRQGFPDVDDKVLCTTVSEQVRPKIAEAYEGGHVGSLLPDYSGGA